MTSSDTPADDGPTPAGAAHSGAAHGAAAPPATAPADVTLPDVDTTTTTAAVDSATQIGADTTPKSSPAGENPEAGSPAAPTGAASSAVSTEPDRAMRFRLTTGFGLIADVGAVVLLWREGITTVATVLCFAAAVAGFDSLVNHPRSRRAWILLVVAVLTPVLVLTGVADQVKRTISGGETLKSMDAGTWIHAHPQDGGDFTRCTTAFSVETGPVRYIVTARSCLPPGPATITTSDDPSGEHDRYTFARGVDCAVPGRRCLTADTSSAAADGSLPDVAAFTLDTAEPSAMLQAQASVATVPVIGSTTVEEVLQRGDRQACHFGLGSAEHGGRQPRQCGELIGMLPNGLGELDAYGSNEGDLGGPVYVSTPDGAAAHILGMVVSANGTCGLDGCHGRVLFLPVHAIEQALGARLLTTS